MNEEKILIDIVQEITKVSMQDMVSKTRKDVVVKARHITMTSLWFLLSWKFGKIATLFNRDRTTVYNAIEQTRNLYWNDFQEIVNKYGRKTKLDIAWKTSKGK
jgi:chromosomal replication initiation ATPase DnaA